MLIIKGEDVVLPLCPTYFVPRGTFLGLPPLLKSGGLSQGVASRYGSDVVERKTSNFVSLISLNSSLIWSTVLAVIMLSH